MESGTAELEVFSAVILQLGVEATHVLRQMQQEVNEQMKQSKALVNPKATCTEEGACCISA